jgi:enoyl-[acyl-carrier protein] reductase/trans-2-enoyl-CoA reductase (NAD+)
MALEVFKKLPLGGVDRRSLVGLLSAGGQEAAEQMLERELHDVQKRGVNIADDAVVLFLGGSNGITRALAVQLLFGEGVPISCVHYDSEKMQIGSHHARAISAAAATLNSGAGVDCSFLNRDATRDTTIEEVIAQLKDKYRAVHLVNGIAAGATKRYEKHGPTQVKDLDMAFDPVLQVPEFRDRGAYRKLGLVDVAVAQEKEIERTNKMMGTSSLLWAEPLAEAGLLIEGESVVAFCDYDFPKDDPVYAMGPLAGAKILQRNTMTQIEERFGVRTVRLCYPAMATTALGAIPGGSLMFALSAQILKEKGAYQSIPQLAAASMAAWQDPPTSELRLDEAYQANLAEFNERLTKITADDVPDCFVALYGVIPPE